MAYLPAEIKFRKSQNTTSGNTNGGRFIHTEYSATALHNVFPVPTDAQLSAGVTFYRKVHTHLAKSDNSVGLKVYAFLSDRTPGDTLSYLIAATARNVQGDIVGTERKYAAGRLYSNALTGASQIVADFDTGNGANLVVQAGDTLWISNGTDYQFVTVATGGITWAGDRATIDIEETLVTDYLTADNATVASVLVTENVTTSSDNWVETTASGTYNESGYPVVLNHQGCIEQSVTLTKTGASAFTATSDMAGVTLGSGSAAADFSPINPNTGTPYFTLKGAGWGGTWQAGETIAFDTHPASVPVWWVYKVNAGAQPLANDDVTLRVGVLG